MAPLIIFFGLRTLRFSFISTPIKLNVRSYFRFHATSKIEEIAAKKVAVIEKRLSLKKPLDIRHEKWSSNIILRSVTFGTEVDLLVRPKNCVIFFPHINSSSDIVDKICSAYHDYGLDVVTVKPKRTHFLIPENGRSIIEELVDKLSGNNLPLHVDKFLVHVNSSGAFFYALLTDYLASVNGTFSLNRIRGQIFDGLPLGDPSTALNTYRSSIPKLFLVGKDLLEEAALNFAKSPFFAETLVYHSFDDTLCSSAEKLIENWKRQHKLDVSISCWKSSVHGEHYSRHPIQYTRALEAFLVKIGLV